MKIILDKTHYMDDSVYLSKDVKGVDGVSADSFIHRIAKQLHIMYITKPYIIPFNTLQQNSTIHPDHTIGHQKRSYNILETYNLYRLVFCFYCFVWGSYDDPRIVFSNKKNPSSISRFIFCLWLCDCW